jgi:hypothetical protein
MPVIALLDELLSLLDELLSRLNQVLADLPRLLTIALVAILTVCRIATLTARGRLLLIVRVGSLSGLGLLLELSALLLHAGALLYQLHALLIIALLNELLALLHQLLPLLNQVLADLPLLRLLAVVVVVMMMVVVMVRTEHCLKIARRLRPLQAERAHGADLEAALKVYCGQTHRRLLRSFSLMVSVIRQLHSR